MLGKMKILLTTPDLYSVGYNPGVSSCLVVNVLPKNLFFPSFFLSHFPPFFLVRESRRGAGLISLLRLCFL